MRLLLDTNIIVDVLSKRDGYRDSLKILKCCEVKRAEGYVSAITVTDVMYILRKNTEIENVREALLALISIADVADVARADIKGAFSCGMRASRASRTFSIYVFFRRMYITSVTVIVRSPVQAVTPSDALALIIG